jgi:SAM-dependent methyltransferase
MSQQPHASPLALDRPDLVHRVREVLDRAGFDEPQISERLGAKEMPEIAFGPLERPRLLRRTRDGDPLSTLIRLFLVGVPVPSGEVRAAVEPLGPADLAELGLIEINGDTAVRVLALVPSEGFILASDCLLTDGEMRRDHVMGVSGSTLNVSQAMIHSPARLTLDLGTGCGYLALLAAAFSQRVLATDLNRRAVEMAQFNTLLNHLTNVESVAGDLFEPVGDLQFDRILSNPPFVVSPEHTVLFRDSGLQRDEITERIVRRIPAHLAEGGFAQVRCNWARISGQDWLERLTGWLSGSGCDAWIIHSHTDSTDVYANNWLRQDEVTDRGRFVEQFNRWMAYYDQQQIEAIDSGLITLRRRAAGRNWIRLDTDRAVNHPNGEAILVGFAARDLLERFGDEEALLGLRLRCRPELRLVQSLRPTESGWRVDDAQCKLGALQFKGEVNPLVFHLLTLCQGQQPLSMVLAQVAARLGQEPDAVAPAGLAAAQSLVEQGFLWPAEHAAPADE